MTSAIISPISVSRALIAAMCAMSSLVRDRLAEPLDLVDHGGDATLDAALERHRVGAGGHVAQALGDDRLGQHDAGGGAVTGDVVGLGRDLLEQLGPHVLVGILQLDVARDGDAVVGDRRRSVLLVQECVATARAQGDLDGVRHLVDPALERASCLLVEQELLCHGVVRPPKRCLLDDGQDVLLGEDQQLLVIQLELGPGVLLEQDLLPD
jgi:hypothetical protein